MYKREKKMLLLVPTKKIKIILIKIEQQRAKTQQKMFI